MYTDLPYRTTIIVETILNRFFKIKLYTIDVYILFLLYIIIYLYMYTYIYISNSPRYLKRYNYSYISQIKDYTSCYV